MVSDEYLALAAEKAGGVNEAALDSLVYWNNPLHLKHWTMNVVELLMITGAVMAFLHARRVLRDRGDPTNLCLWFASVVYLLACEVPLYFPQLLGLDIGLVFFHNEFTLGFLYNQTPLYIVALYPALIYPSYVLVQDAGIFERHCGLWAGAVCVGFVHHCFYEIFDHYGPQFAWWVWNYDSPLLFPRLASVPFTSIVVFSLTPPMVATVLVRLLIAGYVRRRVGRARSVGTLVLLTLLVGGLVPVVNAVLPTGAINRLVGSATLATGLYLTVVALAGVFTLWAFSRRVSPAVGGAGHYPLNFLLGYLLVFALLWLYALPEHLAAQGGTGMRGTPLGSLWYVAGCFLAVTWILFRAGKTRPLSQHGALVGSRSGEV